jgi:HD-GYP domain-containing protein (c-di-GMP phosphodiesterase class II)
VETTKSHQQISKIGDNTQISNRDRAIKQMHCFSEWSGLQLACVDSATSKIIAKSAPAVPDTILDADMKQFRSGHGLEIVEQTANLLFFQIPLGNISTSANNDRSFVAVGVVRSATEKNRDESSTQAWSDSQSTFSRPVLKALLESVQERGRLLNKTEFQESEAGHYDEQLAYSFEEISLLHDLTRNLQVSRDVADLATMCLERMHELIDAAGCAIWIQERNRIPQFIRQGDVPLDELEFAHLVTHHEEHDWSSPLVRNQADSPGSKNNNPGLRNYVMVPISEGQNRYGWIFSCNMLPGQEFGTVQGSLLNSVATILGTHFSNNDLYRQHEELLLSFVRSLVSSLDAKDPYTRGHSQRVALIGRRLAEELGLPEKDAQDIYLSGLLHDIGKIGIDDGTLQKPGKLTDEEFKAIQEHPMIGYNILVGLINLQAVLPGVRNHHESWDGSGYPDRLAEKEIPLMARILAVADSYDAMTSDRPYRKGLPLEKVESILRNGAARQWDPQVVDAYFTVREDVHRICEEFSPNDQLVLQKPKSLADVLFHT